MQCFLNKRHHYFVIILSVGITILVVYVIVSGATTISTNISTGGTLDVTGVSTLTGNVTVGGSLTVNGNVGIGTTSPPQLFSVHGNALIAGTTTISNLVATGTITSKGTATSTFAGGIQVTAGGLQVSTLTSASCDLKTDTSGKFYCGTDATGGLTIGGAISGGTANRVFYEDSSNQLTESANLTFDGTKLGVGTTTPFALLSVNAPAGQSSFIVGSSTRSYFQIDDKGHIYTGGQTPTISNCGTNPSIIGNDIAGRITAGSGSQYCLLTFANSWTHAPSCVIAGQFGGGETGGLVIYNASTTVTNFSIATDDVMAAALINYICFGFR